MKTENRPLSRAAFLLLSALLLAPLSAAQEPEYKSVPFQWYYLPGTSQGECYANCVSACMPACISAAAGAGIESGGCSGECGARCGQCASSFATSTTIQPNDGLPATLPMISEEAAAALANSPVLDGPGITVGGEKPESNLPEAGVTVGSQECPAFAPDGHAMRWDQILGCYDVSWKNEYCAGGNQGCDYCTGKQGCIWNGLACVPCTSPTCIYACPRGPPINVQQQQIPRPAQAAQQAKPPATPGAGSTTPQSTLRPTAAPTPTIMPASYPTPVPTPVPLDCTKFSNCSQCVKAPKKGDDAQCGWSEFLGACVDGDIWRAVNSSGLKVGWVDKAKYCGGEQPETYCFKYSDCLSCAGKGGVKRKCQWSAKDDKCVPYDPTGSFRTTNSPEANDVVLPAMCPSPDCSQYPDCRQCEENAMCLWSRDDEECVTFLGNGDTENYHFYPGNCPANASQKAAPSPTPVPCPEGCKCDGYSRVLKCGSATVNSSGLVSSDRAATNARAATPLQNVEKITFVQEGGAPASYVVQGYKDGIILFSFPVRVDVKATIDAKTGKVEKVEQPWWSFLAG